MAKRLCPRCGQVSYGPICTQILVDYGTACGADTLGAGMSEVVLRMREEIRNLESRVFALEQKDRVSRDHEAVGRAVERLGIDKVGIE